MTHADKIRTMTNWELAEFIFKTSCNAHRITVCERECKECHCSDSFCISEIGEWLISEEDA